MVVDLMIMMVVMVGHWWMSHWWVGDWWMGDWWMDHWWVWVVMRFWRRGIGHWRWHSMISRLRWWWRRLRDNGVLWLWWSWVILWVWSMWVHMVYHNGLKSV